jgi:hypothetical protein
LFVLSVFLVPSPEERDYYPYWSPSPWKDVVIMTDHPDLFCDSNTGLYKGASQNNVTVGKCEPIAAPSTNSTIENSALAAIKAITESQCITAGIPADGSLPTARWVEYSHNMAPPLCRQADWSRVNHLGNGRKGQPLMYNWTLPSIAELDRQKVWLFTDTTTGAKYAKCVARLRYNMSTDDFDRQ